jgi:cbb3-type cytochrome oxidase subunit 3
MNDFTWIYGWASGLLFFGVPLVFIAIVFYIYRPSARKKYRQAKQLPFEDADQDRRTRS